MRRIPPPQKPNILDRAIAYVSPTTAARRYRARMAMEILNSYEGASKSKRSLAQWQTFGGDPDSDILNDLPTLRSRSRDLVRNNPLASGAIKTKITNVVGSGLRYQARIDRESLRMSEDQADEWEGIAEREWRLFWGGKDVDICRILNGTGITRQVYQQQLENGDVFVLFRRAQVPGFPYQLRLQVVEADRVENTNKAMDTETLAGGVEKDQYGAPARYHILRSHPGAILGKSKMEWDIVPAFGQRTGLRNLVHFYSQSRPGQSRGVPDLAAVIEPLKQLGRYTDAEIMAAVISGYFTVFIESDGIAAGGFDYSKFGDELGTSSTDKDYKLGNGAIIELASGEKIHDSNPGRPNQAFDGFVVAILRQIGVALEIPFEILIKHFTASYSAARAAINEMWKYVLTERQRLADDFLRIVHETWMYEAVGSGRIIAPGYFADPLIRAAYLGSEWIGPAKGQIQEVQEVEAAAARVRNGFSTIQNETVQLTGGNWEQNHPQQVKEYKKRLADGLIQETQQPSTAMEDPNA
jgi:lambda family phage portal protein